MNMESRRNFIRKSSAAAAGMAALPLLPGSAWAQSGGPGIGIVLEAGDAVAKLPSSRWAAEHLRDSLNSRGFSAHIFDAVEQVPAGQECILATGRTSTLAKQVLASGKLTVADTPEALGLARGRAGGREVLLACGSDARGLVYALLEVADRAQLASNATRTLRSIKPITERPANRVRSMTRLFVSDVEDKGWYNDRALWRDYLTMLAANRFNRFNLALGIGYDFVTDVRDAYFLFAYPFLVSPAGYDVKAVGLPDEERKANLEMLKFISEEAALRGLHFQLGVWTHAYKWTNSPRANYTISGLTDETQGRYSRDALYTLLEACPAIKGVSFRIHGESGVPEGSYDFWKTVFAGMVKTGRPLELDMHAKGMDQQTIDVAMATGLAVSVAPKFWGEHMGLPYMQSAIRRLEMPPRNAEQMTGLLSRSSGTRSFLRYSYGDLLTEGKKYSVVHRIWPGTQRLLLWGDPASAAAQGRLWSFCGSDGVEYMEPMSFKGRRGSGLPGGREGYADETLKTSGGGWQKYLYTYRLWGRLTYNPGAEPETWQRLLDNQFGKGAAAVEEALASASRVLPLVTSAYAPSGGNNTYWPEMYLNMPIVNTARRDLYGDSPSPRRFGTVTPFDPQSFAGVDEFAAELLKGGRSGKFSPAEVAAWLEELSATAAKKLAEADKKIALRTGAEYRRMALDVAMQSRLGGFFAWKFRAGVLYALFVQARHGPALEQAVAAYRKARGYWAELAEQARGVYAKDITIGPAEVLRGHWSERLPAIDADLADMQKKLDEFKAATPPPAGVANAKHVEKAMATVLHPPKAPTTRVEHAAPKPFKPGDVVSVAATANISRVSAMRLHYRHVNQAENWRVAEMETEGRRWSAQIPGEYTNSPFPLQYYFEVREKDVAWLHPGLGSMLVDQPYFVLRQG
jgi:hypothetical protein